MLEVKFKVAGLLDNALENFTMDACDGVTNLKIIFLYLIRQHNSSSNQATHNDTFSESKHSFYFNLVDNLTEGQNILGNNRNPHHPGTCMSQL